MFLNRNKNILIVVLCIAIPILMILIRLLLSAYTSGDDGYTYMAAQAEQGWVKSTWEMVKFQGRFYQLIIYPLAMLPFTFDNIFIVNIFKAFTFVFFIFGYYYFCSKLLSVKHSYHALGCLAVLICVLETVGGSYNAVHGLPLWFGIGTGVLLFSLGLHLEYLKTANFKFKAFAAATFFYALLSYEIVLLYVPLFFILSAFIYLKEGHKLSNFSKFLTTVIRQNILIFILMLVYLIVYFVFRHFYPGTYVGAQGLSFVDFTTFLKPVWVFSVKSVNIMNSINGNSDFSLTSSLFGVLSGAAIAMCLMRAATYKIQFHSLYLSLLALMILIIYIFVPNVLFGLTERYRIWASHGVEVYLGSLHSAVALSIFIYLFLYLLAIRENANIRTVVIGFIFVFMSYSGYKNSKDAENFYTQSNIMSVRWDVANWASNNISRISDKNLRNATICSDGFISNKEFPVYFRNPDMIADVKIYWSRYFSSKTGLAMQLLDGNKEVNCTMDLFLNYNQGVAKLTYGDKVNIVNLSDIKTLPNL